MSCSLSDGGQQCPHDRLWATRGKAAARAPSQARLPVALPAQAPILATGPAVLQRYLARRIGSCVVRPFEAAVSGSSARRGHMLTHPAWYARSIAVADGWLRPRP